MPNTADTARLRELLGADHCDMSRFMANVSPEPTSGCWLWVGGDGARNYGKFKHSIHGWIRAHRASVLLFNGDLPGHLLVCHKCDNPACVNPHHLFLGTQSDNLRDAAKKGRIPMIANPRPWNKFITHCKRGHEFSESNTRWLGKDKPRRECIACKKAHDRQRTKAARLREGGE